MTEKECVKDMAIITNIGNNYYSPETIYVEFIERRKIII